MVVATKRFAVGSCACCISFLPRAALVYHECGPEFGLVDDYLLVWRQMFIISNLHLPTGRPAPSGTRIYHDTTALWCSEYSGLPRPGRTCVAIDTSLRPTPTRHQYQRRWANSLLCTEGKS